jgi:magnesium-transporting ATPase (P-type)
MSSESLSTNPLERRAHFRTFMLPLGVAIATVIGIGVIVLLLPKRAQVQTIADFLSVLFIWVPAVLCLYVVSVVLLVGVVAMNRFIHYARQRLQKAAAISHSANEKVQETAEKINAFAVDIASRSAGVEHVLNVFDEEGKGESDEPDQT